VISKSLTLFVATIFFSILGISCYGQANKPINLNGNWKLTDSRTSDLTDYYEGLAKKEMGEIAIINSGIMQVKLLDRNFKCEIDSPAKLISKEKCDIFNQEDQGSLKLSDFNFGDNIFVFKTKKIDDDYALYEIVVSEDGDKMILGSDGAYFLFFRQKKSVK